MKKWIMAIAVTTFFIFILTDIVGDFISSDPIHYYLQKKSRIFLVALIAAGAGLISFVFDRLSLSVRHRVKLVAVGVAACSLTAFLGWYSIEFIRLFSEMYQSQPQLAEFSVWGAVRAIFLPVLFPLAATVFLWVIFYRSLKRPVKVLTVN